MRSLPLGPTGLVMLAASLGALCVALLLLGRPATPRLALSIAVSRTPLSAPIYIAADQGFFRQQGLEVELHEVIGGNRSFEMMAEGDADLATSSDSVVMFQSFSRHDFAVLASFVSSDNDVKLIASADGPLRNADDLAQRRIAVTPQSSSEYFLYSVALMHGIDSDSIETRAVAPEDMSADLLDSGIQALSTWEPYAYQVAHALGEKLVIVPTRGLHSTRFNLIARRDILEQRRNALSATLQALDQAIDFLHRDPLAARAIIRDRLELDADFVDWVWPDYNFRLGLPQSLLTSLESGARWAITNGHVEPQPLPNFRDLLDGSLLQQITPTAGRP